MQIDSTPATNAGLTPPPPTILVPVKDWQSRGHLYPATDGAWRALIFNSALNGLDDYGVIVRIGRRVMIDEAAFLRWAREHGGRK